MKTEQLRIKITPDGKVEIKVEGVKGEGCLEIVKPFEEALGGVRESQKLTDEYYEKEEQITEEKTTEEQYGK